MSYKPIYAAVLVAAMFFTGAQTGFSQQTADNQALTNEKPKKFQWGIQAGLGMSKIYTKKLNEVNDKVGSILGFSTNIFLAYNLTQKVSISMEPGFIRKGSVYHFPAADPPQPAYKTSLQLNYIDLPLLVHFHSVAKWSAYAGPSFSTLVSTNLNIIKGLYTKSELSGIIGVNYSICRRFDIGLRYGHGLTKISTIQITDNNGSLGGKYKEYNRYGQLLIRYRI